MTLVVRGQVLGLRVYGQNSRWQRCPGFLFEHLDVSLFFFGVSSIPYKPYPRPEREPDFS